MNLLSWNVNGLRAIVPKLEQKLEAFFASYSADIVCFQETKINSFNWLDDDLSHVNGYESFWAFPKRRKGWSGVVTYCKKGLTIDAKNSFGVRKFDEEGRVVMTDHQTFVLFNVYFPNAGRGEERLKYKLEFYEWFRKLCLDLVQNQQRNVIIVGDVNTAHKEIDVHRPDSSATGFLPEERQWIDEFLASGFIDIFRYLHPTTIAYSWWDPKSSKRIEDKGWRLDYAFVNSKFVHEVVECVYLKNVFGSDHCPLILTLKSKPQLGPHSSPELSSDNLRKRQGKIRSFFEKPNNASTDERTSQLLKEMKQTEDKTSAYRIVSTSSLQSLVNSSQSNSQSQPQSQQQKELQLQSQTQSESKLISQAQAQAQAQAQRCNFDQGEVSQMYVGSKVSSVSRTTRAHRTTLSELSSKKMS